MTNENDVAIVMWITQPFLLASLFSAFLRCVRNPTQPRIILVSTIVSAIISNGIIIQLFGGFNLANFIVFYFLGTQMYNLSLWLARLYVCLRMSKLSPSPTMSTAFSHLAYVVGTLFFLTTVAYITDVIEFFKTQPFDAAPETDATTAAVTMAANLMFEIASIYLHVKSLKMFATSNSTGIKLYIISCSTLTTIVFGLAQSIYFIANDMLMEVMMCGLQSAVLPSSIILGEAIAIRLGKRLDSTRAGSQTATTSVNKREASKIAHPTATSFMKESPIRQPAALAQPSI